MMSSLAVEVGGFAPPGPWMISQVPYSSTPTPNRAYQKNIGGDNSSHDLTPALSYEEREAGKR